MLAACSALGEVMLDAGMVLWVRWVPSAVARPLLVQVDPCVFTHVSHVA